MVKTSKCFCLIKKLPTTNTQAEKYLIFISIALNEATISLMEKWHLFNSHQDNIPLTDLE